MKSKELTLIALMAALICVAGPLTIPIGPVPLSLTTFTIYLSSAILGWKRAPIAVLIYLLIGSLGIPVFSGFSAGFQKLAGMTGGYLVGYLPCALISGIPVSGPFAEKKQEKAFWLFPVFMVIGTIVLYILGTAWFMFQTGNTLIASLILCVIPFLPGDAFKILAASLVSRPIRKMIP